MKTGSTQTGRINPLSTTKQSLKISKKTACEDNSRTKRIEEVKINRRKEAGE
jgi:hypothetical protein